MRWRVLQGRFGIIVIFGLLVTTGCTHLPRDPEKTLKHVQQSHTIRVGTFLQEHKSDVQRFFDRAGAKS